MMIPSNISLYTKKGIFLIIQLTTIIIYIFIIQFSIVILPINIILGIICVLFLPGYNLLIILKPRSNLIEKLGYMTIVSLALANITMFFYYIFLYNIVTTPENSGLIFNAILLILIIQIIDIILISINSINFYIEMNKAKERRVQYESKEKSNKIKKKKGYFNFKYIRDKFNLRNLIISICFFLSLILLCISTLYSHVSNNEYSANYYVYMSNFTFFYRVPFTFYIFLVSSILCLTYIIFFIKNKYFILVSISVFIYCLWILPYLQTSNYFCSDPHDLFIIYNNYLDYGIRSYPGYGFIVKLETFTSFRYSTSLFTAILLTSATGAHINFVLWFLFPLIHLFIPFFFYSVFQKFSNKRENGNLILMILIILAIITPQVIKVTRSASTGAIGTVLFFMLIIEFFDFIHQREFKSKIKDFIIIILLYFFLCLTHFEECIYFLIIVALYPIYYLFFEIKKNKVKNQSNLLSSPLPKYQKKDIEINLLIIGFLLYILLLSFYLTQEFFGYIPAYLAEFLGEDYEQNIIYILYNENKIVVQPVLRGNLSISLIVIWIIILGILIYIIICFLIFFKFYGFFFKILYNINKFFLKKIHNLIKKLISTKLFQLLIFPLFFGVILLINFLYFQFLEEQGLMLMIELILSYSIIIFHIFLFINGIIYYKIKDYKQNYFLLSIIASGAVLVPLFIVGNRLLAFYLFNSRFIVFFIVFNLIIIQNTFFKDFINKKRKYLILMMITFIFLGTFLSLRKLAYG